MTPDRTDARSHLGFLANLGKKTGKIKTKICIVIVAFFCEFGKEIFSVQTAPKKVIKVRKFFLAPFLPLLTKIGGLTAKKFPQPTDFI